MDKENHSIPLKQALLEYKIFSQTECLYILLYLIKHRMAGYKELNVGYKKLFNDTSPHYPIKDRHVKEVMSQGWIKVNELGIFVLQEKVNDIAELLLRIDWFDGLEPRLYNFENRGEVYITNDWKKVYTVRDHKGYNKGQFITQREAISRKNDLSTDIAKNKLVPIDDPITNILDESVIVEDNFGKKIDVLKEHKKAQARLKRQKEKLKVKQKEKEKKQKAKDREKKKKQPKTALDYMKRRKMVDNGGFF